MGVCCEGFFISYLRLLKRVREKWALLEGGVTIRSEFEKIFW